ncbi:nucleotidyltransferase family protein [Formosa maritima]|uniref:Nucleotidyltransferase family protein n=2 Tax=Formosa maritima TaxID=2592046 RepID=A0A5D0GGP2_9FLAO|nr:nucleotidyltransferase family protein [Formosa maritima]
MENKTGKYLKYAIGEIALVVIGILIALSINNWNDNRKNRISERELLDNIHRDFVQNKIQFDTVKAINYQNLATLNSKIALFPIERDSAKIVAFQSYPPIQGISYNPYSSSIKSVIYSNSLELIQDEELRKYLVSWEDVLLDYQEEEIALFKFNNEQLEPYWLENADLLDRDQEMIKDLLSSIKTQNMVVARRNRINSIIKAIEEEPIEDHINEIIRLTQPKDQ